MQTCQCSCRAATRHQEGVNAKPEVAIAYRRPEHVVHVCEKHWFKRLDRSLHTDEDFLQISHELLQRYFVDYQCATTDESDVFVAIHRWWKFDEENRTKYLQKLLENCIRFDVDKECLHRQISFLKTYVAENDPFMSTFSAIHNQELSKKFPPARCASEIPRRNAFCVIK